MFVLYVLNDRLIRADIAVPSVASCERLRAQGLLTEYSFDVKSVSVSINLVFHWFFESLVEGLVIVLSGEIGG